MSLPSPRSLALSMYLWCHPQRQGFNLSPRPLVDDWHKLLHQLAELGEPHLPVPVQVGDAHHFVNLGNKSKCGQLLLIFLDHLIIGESISMFSDRVQQLWSCNLAKWNLITCLILEMPHPLSPSPFGNICHFVGWDQRIRQFWVHPLSGLPSSNYLPSPNLRSNVGTQIQKWNCQLSGRATFTSGYKSH